MNRAFTILAITLSFSGYAATNNSNDLNNLTDLNNDGIKRWQQHEFSGQTTYKVISIDGQNVIQATSEASASGLMLEQQIDLLRTPFLNWRWKVTNALPPLKEQTKNGDDYVARIYLLRKSGFMGLNTKALNYVWSSSQTEGTVWNNAYAGSSVKMVAVQGKTAKTNLWMEEKRNVYQDMIHYFGDKGSDKANQEAYRYIDIVAIMTDTDNSGLTSQSYYGDIVVTAE
ncbi:DUF3047 domain-containing protein [Vibrio sinensis]|uniref:DUF3047 domain-containing protein n=1 Tax=Vibrio sinensis TaxID=2302434 RepID=A0A3A6QWC0_9VIBR|nr:DUF3047 domain-containing protein [Vibrio sinensis]RJX75568.1 DUF3047 domain-containing protein [Vibrio sinensis]